MADTKTLTLADRLNALTATHGGYWTRTKLPDRTEIMRLHLEAGDVFTGTGDSTAAAVAALEAKVAANVEA